MQIPGYLKAKDDLVKAGIDEVVVFCVNDGAVMKAWGDDQGISKSGGMITFMGDPTGALTKAMGIELTHEGPIGKGLIGRCKRTASYIEDGEIKYFTIAENKDPSGADDPAGDCFPEVTCAEAMLEAIAKC